MGTYAIIESSSGIVVNTTEWDGASQWSPDPGYVAIETSEASTGWSYADGVFSPPVVVLLPVDIEAMAFSARMNRDQLMRGVYDPGILMAQRALRMASNQEEKDYAQGKIAELDEYAELLLAVPDQAGFPQEITWPEPPTK